jgi:hypothetical protein
LYLDLRNLIDGGIIAAASGAPVLIVTLFAFIASKFREPGQLQATASSKDRAEGVTVARVRGEVDGLQFFTSRPIRFAVSKHQPYWIPTSGSSVVTALPRSAHTTAPPSAGVIIAHDEAAPACFLGFPVFVDWSGRQQ